jgi:primosomal protein N' (replication factor Y)
MPTAASNAGTDAPPPSGPDPTPTLPLAEVALPVPLPRGFHYLVPPELSECAGVGHRVRVPFGKRRLLGIVLARLPLEASDVPTARLKPLLEASDDDPVLPACILDLARFCARYYRAPIGEVLSAALPAVIRRRKRRKAPRLLDLPETGQPVLPDLTREQALALEEICRDVRDRRYGVTLLQGITGSGKTEVYLRAIGEALAQGRQALLLVPEIALTPQTLRRISERFPGTAVLHSRQSTAERGDAWERARRGLARVVVGPRSAVFAPLEDVGLIVVDEEHEPSYKQDNSPRYHARDLAIVRAMQADAAIVLGSATPSLESWRNARLGRYRRAVLTERPGGAALPRTEVVDLREETKAVKGFPFISRILYAQLQACLERGEQAILFLNRRGFSTFLQCRGCRHVLTCEGCDVALTFHRVRGLAICHGCDRESKPPTGCPACGEGSVHYFGFGTERIEEEVGRRFPGTTCCRLDSDVIAGGADLEEVLTRFRSGEAQVLVGTQMIARGLDFPRVTVVGVISADTALNLPDFRAAERTFQLLAQVSGRAGRAKLPGVTVIQTFCPAHPAVQRAVAHDTDGFVTGELAGRERLGYPPFGRLARLVVSGTRERTTLKAAEELALHLRTAAPPAEAPVLGPAPCPISKLKSRFRYMILIKGAGRAALDPVLTMLDAAPRLPHNVRVAVDIDPVSML